MSVSMETMASLRFGTDSEPGIRRRGTKRFTFVDERTGRPASAANTARAKALVIPPAWTDVWISPDERSHLQATGRDARGRKQYRYHPEFTDGQANDKFASLPSFATGLGSLRRRVDRDMRRSGLDHDQVVATVVRLLDVTSLRIGNIEYSRTNNSFGLTTLRNRHVVVRGTTMNFTFRGKSAHDFDISVDDNRLAKIVRGCLHLPGQQLFEYRAADGSVRGVGSSDVNRYLSDNGVIGATAKTFRTWNATVRAASGLAIESRNGDTPSKRALNDVIDVVAGHLGNTRTVCRNSYIHPAVIDSYVDGSLLKRWQRPIGTKPSGLSVDERRTERLLRRAGS